MSGKPETEFKVGAVRASVYRNTITHNGKPVELPKVKLEVRYKDKSGEWKGTNSLSQNEIPKAILALQKAFDYLTAGKEGGFDTPPEVRTAADPITTWPRKI